jgi:hypothetical protein
VCEGREKGSEEDEGQLKEQRRKRKGVLAFALPE